MLICKPVAEVFEAFVNPAITARFWFTKGSVRDVLFLGDGGEIAQVAELHSPRAYVFGMVSQATK